jgi:phosphoribosylformylglycinamidine cyclo-ligase
VYAPAMAAVRRAGPMHAFAHITGGGLPGNVTRILPDGCRALVRRGSWPVPRIFTEVQAAGDVADDEMARVFNLGIGLVAIVPPEAQSGAAEVLADRGGSHVIGTVVGGQDGPSVVLE